MIVISLHRSGDQSDHGITAPSSDYIVNYVLRVTAIKKESNISEYAHIYSSLSLRTR